MKTKYWIWCIAGVMLLCLGLSLPLLLPGEQASYVQVWSEGELLHTLPLSVDRQIDVVTDRGTNTIVVSQGKVAVTEASCPDGHCMKRGFCGGGVQIVCLPNRLVLRFTDGQSVDAVTG